MAGIMTRDKRAIGIVTMVAIIGGLMFFNAEGVREMILRAKSGLHRVEIWEQTLLRVRESLFFGEGISADRRFTILDGSTWNHSHSVYLATALCGGITGLILFLALLLVGLWRSIVCFRQEEEFTYVGLLLFSSMCMMFGNYRVISHPDAIWIYFWLPLAILAAKETSEYGDFVIEPEKR
jgi:O-antigen ligase